MMQVTYDKDRLINTDRLVAHFLLDESEMSQYSDRIKHLNNLKTVTKGVYKFVAMERPMGYVESLPVSLNKVLKEYNLFMRLVDDKDGSYVYAYTNVDLSDDNQTLRSLKEFVADITRENIEIVSSCKEAVDGVDALASECMQGILDILYKALDVHDGRSVWGVTQRNLGSSLFCDMASLSQELPWSSHHAFKEFVKENRDNNPGERLLQLLEEYYAKTERRDNLTRVSIKRVLVRKYRNVQERYGVEVEVDGKLVTISFGCKYCTLLYIATLLRQKIGIKLYAHELYFNAQGSRLRYQRDVSEAWFEDLYDALFHYADREFKTWIKKVREERGQPLFQAKSQIRSKVKALFPDKSNIVESLELRTERDDSGATYYYVDCDSELIALDANMKQIADDFRRLYR